MPKPKTLAGALEAAALTDRQLTRRLEFLAGCQRWRDDAGLIATVSAVADAQADYSAASLELERACSAAGIASHLIDNDAARARCTAEALAAVHDARLARDRAYAAAAAARVAATAAVGAALDSPEAVAHAQAMVQAAEAATIDAEARAAEAEALLDAACGPLTGSHPLIGQSHAHLSNARTRSDSTADRLRQLARAVGASLADKADTYAAAEAAS